MLKEGILDQSKGKIGEETYRLLKGMQDVEIKHYYQTEKAPAPHPSTCTTSHSQDKREMSKNGMRAHWAGKATRPFESVKRNDCSQSKNRE